MKSPEEIAIMRQQLDQAAFVEHHGKRYLLDLNALQDYVWNDSIDSSWFRTAIVYAAKSQLGKVLGRHEVLQLCAATLRMDLQQLEDSLSWNANYMAFHDGGTVDENHVWPMDSHGAITDDETPPHH
jgi:hypothetical protein